MAMPSYAAVKCPSSLKRFSFKTFSQRVEEIDIDVYRSLHAVKADPSSGSSFFLDALMEWRELNTAEDFVSFYEEMIPLVQTLPQIVLHREKLFSALLQRVNMSARLSLEPILMLIAALSRDILDEFLPFLGTHAKAIVALLNDGGDHDPEILEQVFTSWSYIMMYLQKYLVKDVVQILRITAPLRYFAKDCVREFMAESVSFLLRNSLTHDGLAASQARQKGPCCRLGEGAKRRKRSQFTLGRLPQDVLHQILALLPMKDAARTACVSRELSLSWRYYPELEFSAKTLALDEQQCIQGQMATDIIKRIDDVLRNRAGVWVKRLTFELLFFRKVPFHCVNHWLDAATPRIEELTLKVPRDDKTKYRFPCELFSDENGFSIQSLCLSNCAFHPVQGSYSFGSLKRVNFSRVRITTKELRLFLSNSLALEHLELWYCHEIVCLRIPCTLQLFSFLWVGRCSMLEAIESDAPNLSTFHYEGPLKRFSFGHGLQLKDINISDYPWSKLFVYARTKLPRVAPNLETLFLLSADQADSLYWTSLAPHEKFFHLKYLEVTVFGPRTKFYDHFDYSGLVTFLDASPVLETFILHVESDVGKTHLAFDPSKIRELPRHCHQNIKHVKITGFCPIQEVMELIFYILENAVLLQCLTLDYGIHGFGKLLVARIAQDTGTRDYQEWQYNYRYFDQAMRRDEDPYWEAYLSHIAVGKYILGRVPASVELKILGAPPDEVISSLSASGK